MADGPISQFDLRDALVTPWAEAHLQPVVHGGSGMPLGFEELVRFPGGRGLADWIDAAHRFGRCAKLDRILFLTSVCAFVGSGLPGVLLVKVEAADQSRAPGRLGEIEAPPGRMVLEVTGRAQAPPEGWRSARALFGGRGHSLSLDDVECALLVLRRKGWLRAQLATLDRWLLTRLLEQKECGVRRLRRWLGYVESRNARLIVEGIKERDQLDFPRWHGVRFGKGYALGWSALAETWRGVFGWA